MNLRSMIIATAITFSSFMMAPTVDAKVSPHDQIMGQRLQSFLEAKNKANDAAYIRTLYEKIHTTIETTDHPYVRSELWKLTTLMEDNYAFMGKKAIASTKSNTFIKSNGEVVTRKSTAGVTLTHEELLAKYDGRITTSAIPKTVEDEEEENIPKLTFATASVDEPSAADEWYVLKNSRINKTILRASWLRRVNDFREEEGVTTDIVHNSLVDKTAAERAYKMRSDGTRSHKRTPESAFYDYTEIDQWFKDRGVAYTNFNGATHTENVGQSTLYCNDDDCTDEAEDSLKYVFDYFANEKGQSYDAHYLTLVHPYFAEMGFGIAVDENTNTIYSVMHYFVEARKAASRISMN